MSQLYGFDLLRKQVVDYVIDEFESLREDASSYESEIERLLWLSIINQVQFGTSEYTGILLLRDKDHECALLKDCRNPETQLLVRPQAKIEKFRVDFLVHALNLSKSHQENVRVWRRLIVECDGHEFHERTKEQASKDKSRDRELIMKGYEVFRFTGSEIWRDPWECGRQVLDWAVKGWF